MAAPASVATLLLSRSPQSGTQSTGCKRSLRLCHIDGLACFNRMYLTVTQADQSQVDTGLFADAAFIAKLDVNFVNRFLAPVDAHPGAAGQAPRSWRVLLNQRADPGLAPLQFALAGLNAHINDDLAAALVQTCADCASAPDQRAHHLDFYKVIKSKTWS